MRHPTALLLMLTLMPLGVSCRIAWGKTTAFGNGASAQAGKGKWMLTYTVSGGKWPGIFERLNVQRDGAAVYEVLSGPRVVGAGSGDTIGSFRAPADSRRADLIERAVRSLAPASSTDAAPPAAVMHTLEQDGRLLARWQEGEPSPIAGLLKAVISETQPDRTLTISLADDPPRLVFTAVGASPITLDFGNANLRCDLVFEDGSHRILDAATTAELLGGPEGAMAVSQEKVLVLPLALTAENYARLVQMTLVVQADVGRDPWGVSLLTRRKAGKAMNSRER